MSSNNSNSVLYMCTFAGEVYTFFEDGTYMWNRSSYKSEWKIDDGALYVRRGHEYGYHENSWIKCNRNTEWQYGEIHDKLEQALVERILLQQEVPHEED